MALIHTCSLGSNLYETALTQNVVSGRIRMACLISTALPYAIYQDTKRLL